MIDLYEKGVVVDSEGYYVTALRWLKGTPAPRLNERATSGGKVPRLIMLRDQYAIDNVRPDAKWDFTPVKKSQRGKTKLVRSGTWLLPTEIRWVVKRRRDIGHLWFLSGKKKVWPDRVRFISEDAMLVDVKPPDHKKGIKPVWNSKTEKWMMPRAIAIVDADGAAKNVVSSYVDDDLPKLPDGWSFKEMS